VAGRVLVYRPRQHLPLASLSWVDRRGTTQSTVTASPSAFRALALSGQGRIAAVDRRDAQGVSSVWTIDLQDGAMTRAGGVLGGGARVVRGRLGARLQHRRRFPAEHRDPSRRRYRGRAAHHQECRHPVPLVVYTGCAHDRVPLVLQRHRLGPFTVPVSGDAPPQRLLQAAANDNEPSLSPDGRLLAYSSDESGRREVYVSRFPEMSGRIAISSGGGGRPMWRRDGRELYFLAPDNRVMAVTMTPSSASPPILLFQPALFSSLYPPAPDGSRFLIATRCRQRMWCRWNWC
jgi:hypothetical protein